ncbi:uncharacterized protein V6R79_004936 [Siganus canaliculatus]
MNLKWRPKDVRELQRSLTSRFESAADDRSQLWTWMLNMLHSIEINLITPDWKCSTGQTLIQLLQDGTVTDERLREYLAGDQEKQLKEILEEIRKENQIINQNKELLHKVSDIVSSVCEDLTKGNDGSQRTGMKKDLLKICRAVEEAKKPQRFRPRLTQMVSWCIMALSETGQLVQVSTGEGKSCIVAMFAAFRAMKGDKVDIMSSSSVLAERDMAEWQKFFQVLKISVSCNTRNNTSCYKSQVVYGTVERFAGDWLRHHFQRKDIFGQRKFQCAIVDEVDSMMLDKGHHMVYLSSDMPALQHLNPLLAFIWATVSQYRKLGTGTTVGPKLPFHQVILEIIKGIDIDEFTIFQMAEDTGLLAKGSVEVLRNNLSLLDQKTARIKTEQLAKFFQTVAEIFPSCRFALHSINSDGLLQELNEGSDRENTETQRVPLLLLDGGFCQYMFPDSNSLLKATEAQVLQGLHFTPCDLNQQQHGCYVPGFLSDLVKSKLKVWIENAFLAQIMEKDHEYVIEKHGVVPVDYSCTGVIENSMKWTDGLQQFLEMKHELKLSDMTAITNYMSNVGVFQKYGTQIFGISGTLGQRAETETLQKIYGIQTCRIPTFKRRKLFEVQGVIVINEEKWTKKICQTVIDETTSTPYRGQRAVLVICETIKQANMIHKALAVQVQRKKLYTSNNMDNSEVFQKLQGGDVIVATNLAGRGTDLRVSDQVKEAGGLFVVQTFLPKNARVEAQAFGRTARQGAPGSAQLIICFTDLPEPLQFLVSIEKLQKTFILFARIFNPDLTTATFASLFGSLTENADSEVKLVKKIRDDSVAAELECYIEMGLTRLKKKEELFSQYLELLDNMHESSDKPAPSDLSALHEFWGMWLLTEYNPTDSLMTLKTKLVEDLTVARQKLQQRESPSSNLHHYTAFGNDLNKKGQLAESINLYTKAIEVDPCWAAFAYYNRAFANLAREKNQDRSCIQQALEDLQNSLKSVEFYCEQNEVTVRFFKQTRTPCHDSVTRFADHITTRQKVLLSFNENIRKAIKKLKLARDKNEAVELSKKPVFCLVPLEDFLPMITLVVRSSNDIRHRNTVKIQGLISDARCDVLLELRCLESLGLIHVYTLERPAFLHRCALKIRRAVQ